MVWARITPIAKKVGIAEFMLFALALGQDAVVY